MVAQNPVPARRPFRIVSEPRGPSYEALISYCAIEGAFCTLVDTFPRSKGGQEARASFLNRTEQDRTATTLAGRWPLNDPQSGSSKHPMPLWTFQLTKAVIDALLDSSSGLFGWKCPKLPEDLAIYRSDASVLLGTVAHEHIGWLNLSPAEAKDARLGLIELAPD